MKRLNITITVYTEKLDLGCSNQASIKPKI